MATDRHSAIRRQSPHATRKCRRPAPTAWQAVSNGIGCGASWKARPISRTPLTAKKAAESQTPRGVDDVPVTAGKAISGAPDPDYRGRGGVDLRERITPA